MPRGCHFNQTGAHSASGLQKQCDLEGLDLESGLGCETVHGGYELLAVFRIGQNVAAIRHGRGARVIHFEEPGRGLFWVEAPHACHFLPRDFTGGPEVAHTEAIGIQLPIVEKLARYPQQSPP